MVQVDAQYRYVLETVDGFKDGRSFWQHKLPKQRSFGSNHHVKKNAGINQAGSKATSSICDLIAAELTWKRLPSQLREFLCLRLSWECKNHRTSPSNQAHQLEKSSNSIGFGFPPLVFSSVLFQNGVPLLSSMATSSCFRHAAATKAASGSPKASDTAVSGPSPHRIVVWNLLVEEILHQLINIPLVTGFHRCQVVQDFFHQRYVQNIFAGIHALTIQCSLCEGSKRHKVGNSFC